MTVYAMTSLAGAPGVTTAATALAVLGLAMQRKELVTLALAAMDEGLSVPGKAVCC